MRGEGVIDKDSLNMLDYNRSNALRSHDLVVLAEREKDYSMSLLLLAK